MSPEREEQMIEALAKLMAEQSNRTVKPAPWSGNPNDWFAESDYHDGRPDRSAEFYREKAGRFYQRMKLINGWIHSTGVE